MMRHTLHVPDQLNDGTPVSQLDIDVIESRLLNLAGGFTMTLAVGAWKAEDGTVYREPMRLYMVDGDDLDLSNLAATVRAMLHQDAVYVTHQAIAADLVYAQ